VADGELVATLAGHRGGVSDCAWSAGSDYLATASDDKTLGLWDARSGKLLRQLTGHTAFVFCCNFNAHSNQLARTRRTATWGLPSCCVRACFGASDAALRCAGVRLFRRNREAVGGAQRALHRRAAGAQ
jgi:hypothetical protein